MRASGGISWLVGTLLSALVFRSHFQSCTAKMTSFAFCSIVMSVCSFFTYDATTFSGLIVIYFTRNFLAAAWETAGAGLLVYTMGPVGLKKNF